MEKNWEKQLWEGVEKSGCEGRKIRGKKACKKWKRKPSKRKK